jgi:hypothetical protein
MYVGVQVKYPFSCPNLMKLDFRESFSENSEMSNFMKIRRVGVELFLADGRTDRHEVNSRFWQFCQSA